MVRGLSRQIWGKGGKKTRGKEEETYQKLKKSRISLSWVTEAMFLTLTVLADMAAMDILTVCIVLVVLVVCVDVG